MSTTNNTQILLPSELVRREDQTEFKLKFGGKLNEVDASTLGYSLLNITNLVQEVNQELATGQKIEIKVKAHAPGSFLVHLALDPFYVAPLMVNITPESVKAVAEAATTIIGTLAALFGLRKALKGEPPKEVTQKEGEVQIQNNSGATVIIDQRTYNAYFTNPKVNDALSKTFKTLENDPSISTFEITDEKEVPIIEVSRDEFHDMALSSSVPQAQTRSIIQRASLYIIKPSFERTLKWDVVYAGDKLAVAMKDESFLNRIDKGERFGKGDVLEVELQIDQVLDRNIGTYLNRSHQINKVLEHVPRPEQGTFNFPDEQQRSLPSPSVNSSVQSEKDDENSKPDKVPTKQTRIEE